MLLVGHQPNYLPYLGFFHKIAQADLFVIVDNVQFVKRGPFGWIHRNRIRTDGGEGWSWLTVPVLTKGKFEQKIRDVELDPDAPWARKHWKSLEWAYRGAPHFAWTAERLRPVYERSWKRLAELNEEVIRILLEAFGIRTPVERAGDRGVEGKATEYVVSLCRAYGADAYLSGVHGRDYLDPAAFAAAGIDLRFQEFAHPVYPQGRPGPFVENLSAVDLLFQCGPESRRILLSEK